MNLGGLSFQVIYIPGHSAGSIGLYHSEKKLFMSGDTIYADGSIGRYDLNSASAADLKRSLDIIAKLPIDILLPCHNRIVNGGAQSMVTRTVEQWTEFLTD